MTEFKGRHFGFLLMLCSGWVLARTAMNWPAADGTMSLTPSVTASLNRTATSVTVGLERFSDRPNNQSSLAGKRAVRVQPLGYPVDFFEGLSGLMPPLPAASPFPVPTTTRSGTPHTSHPAASHQIDIDAYAYSFWRGGGRGSGLATAGQYGGGQSGLIATIGLRNASGRRMPIAALVRSSVAHDNLRDRELALGVRWQPSPSLPISISAERRFRGVGADNFAVYAAGGQSDVRLPAGFKLDAFAQAGVVSGQNGGHFFDAPAKAERRIVPASPLPLYLGAGAWAGGQKGIARLDIGPSLRTDLPLNKARVRVSADWRFRVAGDASPGNGPALTLSTGF